MQRPTLSTLEAQADCMLLQTSIDVESMGRRDGHGPGPAELAMAQDSVKQGGGLTTGKPAGA